MTTTDRAQLAHHINQFAETEGWAIFNADTMPQIQRDDEMDAFDSDDAAILHVRAMAEVGSALHQKALELHNANAPRYEIQYGDGRNIVDVHASPARIIATCYGQEAAERIVSVLNAIEEVRAYDKHLDEREIAPDGDSYNKVIALLGLS